jgi:hypothetical protein
MILDKPQRVALLRRTIDKAGGIMAFSRSLGVTHQAVYQWLRRGYVPLPRATEIHVMYNVNRGELVDPALLEMLRLPTRNRD